MLTLVIGGSGSGKSEYAENLLVSSGQGPLVYVATMWFDPNDAECVRRIERHRNLRRNKGFSTRECPVDLEKLALEPGSRVLLECLSNLTANEMFAGPKPRTVRETTEKICQGLERLIGLCSEVCVVSNDIFGDGIAYDEGTMAYMEALGAVNRFLAARVGRVVEVVYSIPVEKGKKKDECD